MDKTLSDKIVVKIEEPTTSEQNLPNNVLSCSTPILETPDVGFEVKSEETEDFILVRVREYSRENRERLRSAQQAEENERNARLARKRISSRNYRSLLRRLRLIDKSVNQSRRSNETALTKVPTTMPQYQPPNVVSSSATVLSPNQRVENTSKQNLSSNVLSHSTPILDTPDVRFEIKSEKPEDFILVRVREYSRQYRERLNSADQTALPQVPTNLQNLVPIQVPTPSTQLLTTAVPSPNRREETTPQQNQSSNVFSCSTPDEYRERLRSADQTALPQVPTNLQNLVTNVVPTPSIQLSTTCSCSYAVPSPYRLVETENERNARLARKRINSRNYRARLRQLRCSNETALNEISTTLPQNQPANVVSRSTTAVYSANRRVETENERNARLARKRINSRNYRARLRQLRCSNETALNEISTTLPQNQPANVVSRSTTAVYSTNRRVETENERNARLARKRINSRNYRARLRRLRLINNSVLAPMPTTSSPINAGIQDKNIIQENSLNYPDPLRRIDKIDGVDDVNHDTADSNAYYDLLLNSTQLNNMSIFDDNFNSINLAGIESFLHRNIPCDSSLDSEEIVVDPDLPLHIKQEYDTDSEDSQETIISNHNEKDDDGNQQACNKIKTEFFD